MGIFSFSFATTKRINGFAFYSLSLKAKESYKECLGKSELLPALL
jgi:hypothetical protein